MQYDIISGGEMTMILLESRSGTIYHSCSLIDLYKIITSNKLQSRHHGRTCLTRSYKFAKEFMNNHHHEDTPYKTRCVIIIDLEKLSSRYKLVPAGDHYNIIQSLNQHNVKWKPSQFKSRYVGNSKAEEYIDEPVTNFINYINQVEIDNEATNYDISEVTNLLDDNHIDYYYK